MYSTEEVNTLLVTGPVVAKVFPHLGLVRDVECLDRTYISSIARTERLER